MRIKKREDNYVELLLAVLDIGAGIIDHCVHARRLIRPLEMQLTTDLQNQWIDFNCHDSSGTVTNRRGDLQLKKLRSSFSTLNRLMP